MKIQLKNIINIENRVCLYNIDDYPFFVFRGVFGKLLKTQVIDGRFSALPLRLSAKKNWVLVNNLKEFLITGVIKKGANYFLSMFTPFECVFCKCKKKKRNYFLWCFAPFECVLNIWKKTTFFFPIKIKIIT